MKDKEKQNISMKEMLTKRSFEPITNCNCKGESRIDYAVRKNEDNTGSMVDLLNQEIEELQKAMQIEEILSIAKIVDKKCDYVKCKNCNVLDNYTDEQLKGLYCSEVKIAENIYNAGCRKVGKTDIVIPKTKYVDKCLAFYNDGKEQAVKEFADNLWAFIPKSQFSESQIETLANCFDRKVKEVIGEKE